jgi:hypothetical protein
VAGADYPGDAEGCGTAEIMRRAGVSKPCVWRWQQRFMREGVAGLLREKTRKPGLPLPPLPTALVDRVVALTLAEPPGEATHWTGRAMARPLACRCAHVRLYQMQASEFMACERMRLGIGQPGAALVTCILRDGSPRTQADCSLGT